MTKKHACGATGRPEASVGESKDSGSDGATRACQPIREPKAFTGRGGPSGTEAHLLRAVRAVKHSMAELAAATNLKKPENAGHRMYLMLHKRKTGAWFLRWRFRGSGALNIPWHEIDEFIAGEPPVLQDWYRRYSKQALEANDALTLARMEVSLYRRRRERMPSAIN